MENTARPKDEPARPLAVTDSNLDLLHSKKYCDVTFVVGSEEERISCHQLFLKARSPVFEVMLSKRWSPDGVVEIIINDTNPKIFKLFVEFIYADKFTATFIEALELLHMADMYDVYPLKKKCGTLLKREVKYEDALEVFQTARLYDVQVDVLSKAGDLLARNLPRLLNDANFSSHVDEETLAYLFTRDDIDVKEVELFKFAVSWAEEQCKLERGPKNVKDALAKILPLIRLLTMKLQDFTTVVVPTKLLSESDLLDAFIYFGSDASQRKELERSMKFSANHRDFGANIAVLLTPASCQSRENVRASGFVDSVSFTSETPEGCRYALKNIIVQWPEVDTENSSSEQKRRVAETESPFEASVKILTESTGYESFGFAISSLIHKPGERMDVIIDRPITLNAGATYTFKVMDGPLSVGHTIPKQVRSYFVDRQTLQPITRTTSGGREIELTNVKQLICEEKSYNGYYAVPLIRGIKIALI